MSDPPRTIVIVGAGFSGTAVAIHLLRLSLAEPLRVVLVDPAAAGRGTAYAAREYPYLLNVPAGRMSASSDDPTEFLTFARRRLPKASAEDFLPRALYGDYLESLLRAAERTASPQVRLERIRGHAHSIERGGSTSPIHVNLADGRRLTGDDVVLALGNPAPTPIPGTEALSSWPRYVADPWSGPASFHAGETVLVIGTGLTMADIVVAGVEASRGAIVHAISRHGLIPPSQTAFRHTPVESDPRTLLRAASLSARRLLHTVRALSEEMEYRGGDWREAITLVRNIAPELWQRLPARERRRFLRHVRCYWDIHRHRLPDRTLAALHDLRRKGTLQVHAGRLLRFEPAGERVRASWRPRGTNRITTLLIDRAINCTGPDYNAQRSRDPLLRSLLSQGIAVSDELGLGVRTGAQGALIDQQGNTADHLYYVGPMLRADHWETTAIPELRRHAETVARHLAAPRTERRSVAHEACG